MDPYATKNEVHINTEVLNDNTKIKIIEKTSDPKHPLTILKIWSELKAEVMVIPDQEDENFTPYNERMVEKFVR